LRVSAATPTNERRAFAGRGNRKNATKKKRNLKSKDGDGAALIQGRDIHALHLLDTARTRRPVSTVPDTQNLLGVEHARLHSLVA